MHSELILRHLWFMMRVKWILCKIYDNLLVNCNFNFPEKEQIKVYLFVWKQCATMLSPFCLCIRRGINSWYKAILLCFQMTFISTNRGKKGTILFVLLICDCIGFSGARIGHCNRQGRVSSGLSTCRLNHSCLLGSWTASEKLGREHLEPLL